MTRLFGNTPLTARARCGGVTSFALLPVVFPLVSSPITSRSAAQAARGGEHEGRPRLDEEVLDAPKELRQPVVGVGGALEDQGRERLALCTLWISQDSRMAWSSRGEILVSSGLIARQMEELEEERKMSTSSSSSAWASLVSSVKTHPHDVAVSGCDVMDWEERRPPATPRRPVSACTVLLHRRTQSGCAVFPFCLTLPSQDEPKLPPDEKELDARALGGPVLGVGGAQEQQGRTLQVCHTFYKRFHFSLCQRHYEQVRLVHLITSVPVPQIQEQIVDVIKVIPQEQMSKRLVEQIVDVPMPQILEQIVDVPVPQIMEETVEVAKLIPQERLQQRTLGETVNVPVPQIQEQIVGVVEALLIAVRALFS